MFLNLRTRYALAAAFVLAVPLTGLYSQSDPKNSRNQEKLTIEVDNQDDFPSTLTPPENLERYRSDSGKTIINPFENRLDLANLILHGKVIRKRYAKSTNPGPLYNTPITFVDFKVIEVIAGRYEGAIYTLRHIGGPRGDGENYVVPSHVNHFNLGDEEILYIRGNGQSMDPVLTRFRILEDSLYSVGGRRLLQDPQKNILASGQASDAETVKTVHIETLKVPASIIHNEDPADDMESDRNCQNRCESISSKSAGEHIRSTISRKAKTFQRQEKTADMSVDLRFSDSK